LPLKSSVNPERFSLLFAIVERSRQISDVPRRWEQNSEFLYYQSKANLEFAKPRTSDHSNDHSAITPAEHSA
jgi:hypothetical protein